MYEYRAIYQIYHLESHTQIYNPLILRKMSILRQVSIAWSPSDKLLRCH